MGNNLSKPGPSSVSKGLLNTGVVLGFLVSAQSSSLLAEEGSSLPFPRWNAGASKKLTLPEPVPQKIPVARMPRAEIVREPRVVKPLVAVPVENVNTQWGVAGGIQLPLGWEEFRKTNTLYHELGKNQVLRDLIESRWRSRGKSTSPRRVDSSRDTYTATFVESVAPKVHELLQEKDMVLTQGSDEHIGYAKVGGKYIAFKYGSGSGGIGNLGQLKKKQSPRSGTVVDIPFIGPYYQNFYIKTMDAHPYGRMPADGGTPGADMLTILARISGQIYFHGSSAKINGAHSGGCYRLRTPDIIVLYELGIIREGMTFEMITL